MIGLPEELQKRLDKAKSKGLWRELKNREGLDLTSNDYLGFAADEKLQKKIKEKILESHLSLGATGSRLLRGQLETFETLEKKLARFTNRQASLFFPTGYQANVGLFSCLLSSESIVFSDEYNHASIIDGIKLSKSKVEIFKHNDIEDLKSKLLKNSDHSCLKVIVTESLFSMEGDRAKLRELASLSREFGCLLVVDEAHSTGLFGGGLVQSLNLEDEVFATLHTGGKSLGSSGAWVSSSQEFKDYLVNFCRSFIFSTAPLPLLSEILQSSLEYWSEVGERRAQQVLEKSHTLALDLREYQKKYNYKVLEVAGPFVPVILGEAVRTLRVAEKIQKLNYDLRCIRPPTVPEGQSRLRIALNFNISLENIEKFKKDFYDVMEQE